VIEGFSYGAEVSATLAAMFPDRIDKMVLDGVVNVDQYYEGGSCNKLQNPTRPGLASSKAVWKRPSLYAL
jgi:pimeloyl-ACP methyl ester carboxylesterase